MVPLIFKGKAPAYEQIYEFYRTAILDGRLKGHEKMPSHRFLASELHVAKNTVLKSYEQLVAEGYVVNIERKGLYVSNLASSEHSAASFIPNAVAARSTERKTRQAALLPNNIIDEKNFPVAQWRKCSNWALDNITFQYNENKDADPLKQPLIDYLYHARGVVATPERMVIGSGANSLFFWLAFVLCKTHSTIFFENPGYPRARDLFSEFGFRVVPIPVDENGINVERLTKEKRGVVYLTPSHQFPTGTTIPVGNRLQILRWAEKNDSYIIEDDFDCEFRYKTKLIPSFQGLDNVNRVIYVGSFSNSIMPSLRVAYLVLPEKLAIEYKEFMHLNSVTFITKKILATFMERGYWDRHLKKMRKLYSEKYMASVVALRKLPKNTIGFSNHASGLNILLMINTTLNEDTLIKRALEKKIVLTPASGFYYKGKGKPARPEVLFEFGNIETDKIGRVIRTLHEVWFAL